MDEDDKPTSTLVGAQGLAVFWLVTARVLGPGASVNATSGFCRRSDVAAEVLVLVSGFQAQSGALGQTSVDRGLRRIWHRCAHLVSAAEIAMGLGLFVRYIAGEENVQFMQLLRCLLFVEYWVEPDATCPAESVWLIAVILSLQLIHVLALQFVIAKVASISRSCSKPCNPLLCLGAAFWLCVALPQLFLAVRNGGAWLWRRQAAPTWFWPPALAADFALGACAGAAARIRKAGDGGGTLTDRLVFLALIAVWLFPIPDAAPVSQEQVLDGPLAARFCAPVIALVLCLGNETRTGQLLAHPAVVGLGESAIEVLLLSEPLVRLFQGPLRIVLQLDSAPCYIAFLSLLWICGGLLSSMMSQPQAIKASV